MKTIKLGKKDISEVLGKPVYVLPKAVQKAMLQGKGLTLVVGDYNPTKLPHLSQPSQKQSLSYKLLPQLADNGNSHTQDEWIQYFSNLTNQDIGTFHDFLTTRSPKAIDIVRKAMDSRWIATPIRLEYNKEDLTTKITDNFGSDKRTPRTATLEVPVYGGYNVPEARMDNVLEDQKGLAFMQFITGLDIPKGKLKDKLVNLSHKRVSEQWLWTPNQESRKQNPVRALGLIYDGDNFRVYCDDLLSYDGCAVPVSKN